MDPQTEAQQPADAQPVAEDGAAASAPPRESESGVMNRLIRLAGGWIGRGEDEASSGDDAGEQPAADAQTTEAGQPPPSPDTVTLTREQFDREVQSRKDRELTKERREDAFAEAEQGSLAKMQRLAERGDDWAKQQLSERGDVWARGEIAVKDDLERRARENDPIPHVTTMYDQYVLHAAFEGLPEAETAKVFGDGVHGFDGRQGAVKQAIALHRKQAAEEALAKALTDEGYANRALSTNSALRKVLLTHPTVSKQLRALFHGDIAEPDAPAGVGAGARAARENDEMNDAIRHEWRRADLFAPEERAAMAPNGRLANRDLLDDD